MIGTIGMMIAAYVLYRMFEVLLFAPARYGSKTQQGLAVVGAVVVAMFTLICVLDLLTAGTRGLGTTP